MNAEQAMELVRIRTRNGETHGDVGQVLERAVGQLNGSWWFQSPEMVSLILPQHGTRLPGGLKAIYLVGDTVLEVAAYPNPQKKRTALRPLTAEQYREAIVAVDHMAGEERVRLSMRIKDYEQRQQEETQQTPPGREA